MGVKKFKNLFQGSAKKKPSSASTTKEQKMTSPATNIEETKKRPNINHDNVADKAQIEQLKKSINKKLNDPEIAKKAAQIIEEMLKNK